MYNTAMSPFQCHNKLNLNALQSLVQGAKINRWSLVRRRTNMKSIVHSQQNADIKMFDFHTMFTSRKTIIHISLCGVYNVDASVWFAVLLYDYLQKRMVKPLHFCIDNTRILCQ